MLAIHTGLGVMLFGSFRPDPCCFPPVKNYSRLLASLAVALFVATLLMPRPALAFPVPEAMSLASYMLSSLYSVIAASISSIVPLFRNQRTQNNQKYLFAILCGLVLLLGFGWYQSYQAAQQEYTDKLQLNVQRVYPDKQPPLLFFPTGEPLPEGNSGAVASMLPELLAGFNLADLQAQAVDYPALYQSIKQQQVQLIGVTVPEEGSDGLARYGIRAIVSGYDLLPGTHPVHEPGAIIQVDMNFVVSNPTFFQRIDLPIVLISGWGDVAKASAHYLQQRGVDAGFLDSSLMTFLAEWYDARPGPTQENAGSITHIDVHEVHHQLEAGTVPFHVVDIRNRNEYQGRGYLYGAENIPATAVAFDPGRIQHWPPSDEPILLVSYFPERSEIVAAWLAAQGYSVSVLDGGYERMDALSLFWMPTYPNRDRFWTAAQLYLMAHDTDDVVFIDPRSPDEVAKSRIRWPRTLNIPTLEMGWDEVMAQLPVLSHDKRYIGMAYDQASAYQSMLLGLEMSRLGYVWLGLNSLPYQYSAEQYRVNQQHGYHPDPFGADMIGLYKAFSGFKQDMALPALLFIFLFGAVTRGILFPLQWIGLKQPATLAGGLSNVTSLVVLILVSLFFLDWLSFYHSVQGDSFLWIDDFLTPDPYLVFPALVAAALFCQLSLLYRLTLRSTALILAASLFVLYLLMTLSAAMSIYVFAVTVTGLIGNVIIIMVDKWRAQSKAPAMLETLPSGPVPLWETDRYERIGSKASLLAAYRRLYRDVAIPDGFVLTGDIIHRLRQGDAETVASVIASVRKLAGGGKLILRSCAYREDADATMAGRFDSHVAPADEAEFLRALELVWQSLAIHDDVMADAQPSIIVQRWLPFDLAGVAFSHHPVYPIAMAIEGGEAEAVTAGSSQIGSVMLCRETGSIQQNDNLPLSNPVIGGLRRVILNAEVVLGGPVDIEWGVAAGRLYLLQLRPQFSISDAPPEHMEQLALISAGSWKQLTAGEFSEVLARPSHAAATMYKQIYGDSVMIGFGRLLYNPDRPWWKCIKLPKLSRRKLADRLEAFYSLTSVEGRRWQAVDLAGLSLADLRLFGVQLLDAFAQKNLPFSLAVTRLSQRYNQADKPLSWPEVGSAKHLLAALSTPDEAAQREILRRHGLAHRAVQDIEIASPRFDETAPIWPVNPDDTGTVEKAEPNETMSADLIVLKDDVHNWVIRDVALLRRLILEIGRRLGIGDAVFTLSIDEIFGHTPMPSDDERAARAAAWQRLQEVKLPEAIRRADVRQWDFVEQASGVGQLAAGDGQLVGKVVSLFEAEFSAPVINISPAAMLEPTDGAAPELEGKIVILHEGYVSIARYFDRIRGILMPFGGQLSHLAIVSREAKMPAIFGIGQAVTELPDGLVVTMQKDGRILMDQPE